MSIYASRTPPWNGLKKADINIDCSAFVACGVIGYDQSRRPFMTERDRKEIAEPKRPMICERCGAPMSERDECEYCGTRYR